MLIYKIPFGLNISVKNGIILNKYYKKLNIVDKTLYEAVDNFKIKCQLPTKSTFTFAVSDEKTILKKIIIKGQYKNAHRVHKYWSKKLKVECKKLLFSGNENEAHEFLGEKNILIVNNGETKSVNVDVFERDSVMAIYIKDFIQYLKNKNIYRQLFGNNKFEKYLCLMQKLIYEYFVEKSIKNVSTKQSFKFNLKYLDDYFVTYITKFDVIDLTKTFINSFYKNNKFKGYFYTNDIMLLYNKLHSEIWEYVSGNSIRVYTLK